MTHCMDEKPFNRVFLLVDSKVANYSLHALSHSNTHTSHVTGHTHGTGIHMLTHTCK